MLQGNATLGAIIWGEGRTLRITLGRADLWDHRGGMPWREGMSYNKIRTCLEKGDEKGLRKLFEGVPPPPGVPHRPTVIPVGRIDLEFARGVELEQGSLDTGDGSVVVTLRKAGRSAKVRIALGMTANLVWIKLPASLASCKLRPVPSWEFVGEELSGLSFDPPKSMRVRGVVGWTQSLPVDPAVSFAARRKGNHVVISVERGETDSDARKAALAASEDAARQGGARIERANKRWWNRYWRDVPNVEIPNERLAFLYRYGMYRFAGLTSPWGTPGTLQGPWIEEYRLPPWSSDYHFNINVQMCYQPAYHGNRVEHLRPLFDLVLSWEDQLRHNARIFLGIDDGMMLPHAVDDRCTCMGGFWTGSVDHGCTAWVALMMYRYYRYTLDRDFLKQAYPFLVGAMRVYEEMIERDGGGLCLAVGVSPEYRGAQMDAWGKNASFQLACVHALTEACAEAARTLRRKPRPEWKRIQARLPKAALTEGSRGAEVIGLWDGLSLEESHRHHSHLGAITPFDVIDPDDPQWRDIVEHSIAEWIYRGPGLWSGWCLSWASAIHSRMGNGESAEFYLEAFDRFYTNEGQGTLHDAWAAGFSLTGQGGRQRSREGMVDVMQIDGAMGTTAAIQEMLLHTRRGVNHIFAGVPWRWKDCSFDGMRTDGAFLIGAARLNRQVASVTVKSEKGGTCKIASPWKGGAVLRRGRTKKRINGKVLKVAMKASESVTLTPA